MYLARIVDLGRGDLIKLDCATCHHVALLTPEALLRLGLSPAAKVLDLKTRLRCRRCGMMGSRRASADRRSKLDRPRLSHHVTRAFGC